MNKPKALKFSVNSSKWVKTPEFGGGECVHYRSPDNTIAVVGFRESGKHSFKYPFNEFAYVLSGSAKVSVRGGDSFTIGAGDVLYVEEGTHMLFCI